jgi:hypothetical protein
MFCARKTAGYINPPTSLSLLVLYQAHRGVHLSKTRRSKIPCLFWLFFFLKNARGRLMAVWSGCFRKVKRNRCGNDSKSLEATLYRKHVLEEPCMWRKARRISVLGVKCRGGIQKMIKMKDSSVDFAMMSGVAWAVLRTLLRAHSRHQCSSQNTSYRTKNHTELFYVFL